MTPPEVAMPPAERESPIPIKSIYDGLLMSREAYSEWDQKDLGTGEKYEWKAGTVEPAGDWMKPNERHIAVNLTDLFGLTSEYRSGGRLLAETEVYLPKIDAIRIPDIAYFTKEEIGASRDGDPIPSWVVEIISPSERFFHAESKANEYLAEGVQIVWQIMPPYGSVRIFRKGDEVIQVSGDTACSTAPAVKDFAPSVSQILAIR